MSSKKTIKWAKDVEAQGEKLADIFEKNSVELTAHYCTRPGLKELSDIFSAIPENERADIFSAFIEELQDRDILYDVDQFRGPVQ